MDRYMFFQLMLATLADAYEIKNATLKDCMGRMTFEATSAENDVSIEVVFTEKENQGVDDA